MKRVKSEDIRKVIDIYKTVEADANHRGKLDMGQGAVRDGCHQCNTVHCAGGWFAVALLRKYPFCFDNNDEIGYNAGASAIATILGFGDPEEIVDNKDLLITYLADHPEQWGNEFGEEAFSREPFAYTGLSAESSKPMTLILRQWEVFYTNVKKLEDEEKCD